MDELYKDPIIRIRFNSYYKNYIEWITNVDPQNLWGGKNIEHLIKISSTTRFTNVMEKEYTNLPIDVHIRILSYRDDERIRITKYFLNDMQEVYFKDDNVVCIDITTSNKTKFEKKSQYEVSVSSYDSLSKEELSRL